MAACLHLKVLCSDIGSTHRQMPAGGAVHGGEGAEGGGDWGGGGQPRCQQVGGVVRVRVRVVCGEGEVEQGGVW